LYQTIDGLFGPIENKELFRDAAEKRGRLRYVRLGWSHTHRMHSQMSSCPESPIRFILEIETDELRADLGLARDRLFHECASRIARLAAGDRTGLLFVRPYRGLSGQMDLCPFVRDIHHCSENRYYPTLLLDRAGEMTASAKTVATVICRNIVLSSRGHFSPH
jgi:hypothetical protein